MGEIRKQSLVLETQINPRFGILLWNTMILE